MSVYKWICEDCNKEFELPDNIIEMARTRFCPDCFKVRLKKVASMPLNKFMFGCAKSVIKGSNNG